MHRASDELGNLVEDPGNEIDGKDDSFAPLLCPSSDQHEATFLVLYDPTIASGTRTNDFGRWADAVQVMFLFRLGGSILYNNRPERVACNECLHMIWTWYTLVSKR